MHQVRPFNADVVISFCFFRESIEVLINDSIDHPN